MSMVERLKSPFFVIYYNGLINIEMSFLFCSYSVKIPLEGIWVRTLLKKNVLSLSSNKYYDISTKLAFLMLPSTYF